MTGSHWLLDSIRRGSVSTGPLFYFSELSAGSDNFVGGGHDVNGHINRANLADIQLPAFAVMVRTAAATGDPGAFFFELSKNFENHAAFGGQLDRGINKPDDIDINIRPGQLSQE
jgi:hypothetical protein